MAQTEPSATLVVTEPHAVTILIDFLEGIVGDGVDHHDFDDEEIFIFKYSHGYIKINEPQALDIVKKYHEGLGLEVENIQFDSDDYEFEVLVRKKSESFEEKYKEIFDDSKIVKRTTEKGWEWPAPMPMYDDPMKRFRLNNAEFLNRDMIIGNISTSS